MKRRRPWVWEHAWLVWTVAALVLFPLVAAVLKIPSLFSTWPPLLAGVANPNVLYCFHRLHKNQGGKRYYAASVWFCWFLSVLMAVLWFGAPSPVRYGELLARDFWGQ